MTVRLSQNELEVAMAAAGVPVDNPTSMIGRQVRAALDQAYGRAGAVEKDGAVAQTVTVDRREVTVTVTRSGGLDDAVLVLVDTDFEPDGSDGRGGMRVAVNDAAVLTGVGRVAGPTD